MLQQLNTGPNAEPYWDPQAGQGRGPPLTLSETVNLGAHLSHWVLQMQILLHLKRRLDISSASILLPAINQ